MLVDAIAKNPDAFITLLGIVGGWFGLDRVRKKRAAAAAEVDRWASTAAAAVALAIRAGMFGTHDEAASAALLRFRQLATAVGVEVSAEHEARAIAVMHEVLVAAGKGAMEHDLGKLAGAADALLAESVRLDRVLAGKERPRMQPKTWRDQ